MDQEILKAVLEAQADGEEQLSEILTKSELDDKGIAAFKAAYRLLKGFEDKLPKETALATLAELTGYKLPVEKAKGEVPPQFMSDEDKKKKEEEEKMNMKKSLEGLPEDIQKQFEEIEKANQAKIDELSAKNAEVVKKNEEIEKALKAEQDRRELESWIAKAKDELDGIPGKSSDELGATCKKMADVDPELANEQFEIMKKSSDALKQGALYKELGGKGADTTGSAYSKLQKKADAIIEKSDSALTKEQAFAKALEQNPALYQEYMNENPSQMGN
jgi:hypothetical protein